MSERMSVDRKDLQPNRSGRFIIGFHGTEQNNYKRVSNSSVLSNNSNVKAT